MNPARLVQSIGWMAFLALLLAGGGYASYIASWQHAVLLAATALFAALVLFDALFNRGGHAHDHHDHDHGNATDQWVQTLVHLLPLFLVLTLGVTTLGSQSITSLHKPTSYGHLAAEDDRRLAAGGQLPVAGAQLPAPGAQLPAPGAQLPAPGAQLPAPGEPPPAGVALLDGPTPPEPTAAVAAALQPGVATAVPLALLDLYYPKKHPGVQRVETIGRLMIPTPEELAKVPPEMDRADLKLLLYRHVMTCCAADASPVFVVLRGRETAGLKVDDWVRVTGTWIPAPGLGDMAKIEVDALEPVATPAEPFLQAPKE